MTKFIKICDGLVLTQIEEEPERICQQCGKFAETRPYGPGGQRICFACGMKDEETTKNNFNKLMDGI